MRWMFPPEGRGDEKVNGVVERCVTGGQQPAVRSSTSAVTAPAAWGKGEAWGIQRQSNGMARSVQERGLGTVWGLGQLPQMEGRGAHESRQDLVAGWTEEVRRNESSSPSLFLAEAMDGFP